MRFQSFSRTSTRPDPPHKDKGNQNEECTTFEADPSGVHLEANSGSPVTGNLLQVRSTEEIIPEPKDILWEINLNISDVGEEGSDDLMVMESPNLDLQSHKDLGPSGEKSSFELPTQKKISWKRKTRMGSREKHHEEKIVSRKRKATEDLAVNSKRNKEDESSVMEMNDCDTHLAAAGIQPCLGL